MFMSGGGLCYCCVGAWMHLLWQLRGGYRCTSGMAAGIVLFPRLVFNDHPAARHCNLCYLCLCAQVEFRRLHDGEFSNAPRLRRDYLTAHPMAAAVLASSAGLSPALCQVRLARRPG